MSVVNTYCLSCKADFIAPSTDIARCKKCFRTHLVRFVAEAQKLIDTHLARNEFNWQEPLTIDERGQKYIRIVNNAHGGRSVFCFVDTRNGNVLKAKSWKAPELKNPRSSIYDKDFGISGITAYGTKYLSDMENDND
jgi:hypothetical protein